MKKISLMLISLLLALSLLAGCAAPDFVTGFVVSHAQEDERGNFGSFDELEYIRPELAEIQTTAEKLFDALDSPFAFGRVNALLDELYAQCSNFDTMYVLAYIHRCREMGDEYYAAEYNWLMSADAQLQHIVEQTYSACANSIHILWLEPLKFWDGFREEYSGSVMDEAAYEQYAELAGREAELLSRYRREIAAPTVEIAGQEWPFEEYILQLPPYAHAEAYEEFYKKYNSILGEIYIELISIRRDMAELLGYESYAAMEYELGYGRDYSPAEAEIFMGYVKQHMAALGGRLNEQGNYYENLDSQELIHWLEAAAEGFGGEIEEAFLFMREHDLYDFSQTAGKQDISFQTYLVDYDAPYLFLSPYGDRWDVVTLFHEFGHYADSYMRYNAYESIDLSECFSQAMQFLALSQLNDLPDGEREELYQMTLLDITGTMLEQSALAEFELRAYEMEAPTLDKLNELWLQLSKDYGIYDELSDYAYRYAWSDTPHLFEQPFYVISYPVSAAVALELYELELERKGAGTEKFIEMSQSCLAGLMETVDFAGLQYPLSRERVRDMAELLGN